MFTIILKSKNKNKKQINYGFYNTTKIFQEQHNEKQKKNKNKLIKNEKTFESQKSNIILRIILKTLLRFLLSKLKIEKKKDNKLFQILPNSVHEKHYRKDKQPI